jgi:hypothetical protein
MSLYETQAGVRGPTTKIFIVIPHSYENSCNIHMHMHFSLTDHHGNFTFPIYCEDIDAVVLLDLL